ncbi:MAG: DEAD/DEAH box helicase, partial [Candidatus Bipolaricaulota bacterium]
MGESKKEKFKKILKLEKKKGFQDNAVLGGLESLTPGLVENEEIRELLEGYSKRKPFARQEIVEDIENLLETSEDEDSRDLSLDQPIEDAVGVGSKRGEKFSGLGIETIRDLLFHFPRRIEDRRIQKDISEVKNGDSCTVVGEVKGLTKLNPRRKVELVKAEIGDGTGTIYPVWFNQPWIKNQLNQETEIALYGEVKREYGEIQMENPVWEPKDEKEKTRKLVPIYPGTEDLSQKVIRWVVRRNLKKFLPAVKQFPELSTAENHGFWGRRTALRKIHIPENTEDFERARKSLSFSELFLFYVKAMDKTDSESEDTPCLAVEKGELVEFRENLPFSLTDDQENVLEEILTELKAPEPMNRLLQGDVGTGKTVVAAAAGYVVANSGFQTAMMAPTTVLAEQHFRNLEKIFLDLPVEVELLTGDTSEGKREEILSRLESGEIDILVGTHALLEEA